MKRKHIHPKEASVAATFYEPVYQRLRQWHNGREIQLLGFVHGVSAAVRKVLDEYGAKPSETYRARCFAEVWEVSVPTDATASVGIETAEWDRRISEALGCLDGKHSAATGTLVWGDVKNGTQRRHFTSRLVEESLSKKGRSR